MKSVESKPTPTVSPDNHATTATTLPSVKPVAPLTTEIETFTSIREKLILRMKEEIQIAEEKLEELNQQFEKLFPELAASNEQPTPKTKKSKPKAIAKSEAAASEASSSSEE